MAQLHCIHAGGLGPVRPTNDVDMVLHIETKRGLPAAAASALESLGYELVVSIDPREGTAHRFRRKGSVVDVVTSGDDVVDVLTADHAAPRVRERLRGRELIAIRGRDPSIASHRQRAARHRRPGNRAQCPEPSGGRPSSSKQRRIQTDSRNPERHLQDSAALLSCIADPYDACESLQGADGQRLRLWRRRCRTTPSRGARSTPFAGPMRKPGVN